MRCARAGAARDRIVRCGPGVAVTRTRLHTYTHTHQVTGQGNFRALAAPGTRTLWCGGDVGKENRLLFPAQALKEMGI